MESYISMIYLKQAFNKHGIVIIMKIIYKFTFSLLLILLTGCEKKLKTNIYDSNEYKTLTDKDIRIGESIFAIACGQCHRFGNNGAIVLENKKYWDQAATKGIDELFKSVWEGYKGEYGVMPPKGFYRLGSEEEIKKSVLYLFHLAKKAQVANEKNKSSF